MGALLLGGTENSPHRTDHGGEVVYVGKAMQSSMRGGLKPLLQAAFTNDCRLKKYRRAISKNGDPYPATTAKPWPKVKGQTGQ